MLFIAPVMQKKYSDFYHGIYYWKQHAEKRAHIYSPFYCFKIIAPETKNLSNSLLEQRRARLAKELD